MLKTARQDRHTLGVTAPRLRWLDLLRESALSVIRHPGRSVLTALGTVLGAAAFVSTLGVTSTLSQQVTTSFDARRATEVVVQPEDAGAGALWQEPKALGRLKALNGVTAAGRRVTLPARPIRRGVNFAQSGADVPLIGADPGALRVMAPRLTAGRTYDEFHDQQATRVVLLPGPIANRLGITRTGVAVFIDDQAYTVMGIYDDVARRPEAMLAAIIPYRTAEPMIDPRASKVDRDVVIETAPGAAQLIGRQAPLALSPEAPNALRAIAPPDPRTLRREIEKNVTQSTLLLCAIALIIGTVSIGNAATAGIAARIPEIGLRRAVGGRPAHIFAQLLGETTMLGALGGGLGALTGVLITSVVCLWNGWTPVIDLRTALLASAAGACAGLLAGLVPAARAMRIQPVAALQR